MIIDDPDGLGEDIEQDHNQIINLLYIHYGFKTMKLVVIIFNLSYFLGMLWIVVCDVTHILLADNKYFKDN